MRRRHHNLDEQLSWWVLSTRLRCACARLNIKTTGDLLSEGKLANLWYSPNVGMITWGEAVRFLDYHGITFLEAVESRTFAGSYEDLQFWQEKWLCALKPWMLQTFEYDLTR